MKHKKNYSVSSLANHRFHSLDFLKFILAVIIVFHHYQQAMEVKFEHFNFFNGRFYFGYAVEFFFIISGFVIAVQTAQKGFGDFRSWMMPKIRRIIPMAVLSVLACLCYFTLIHFLYNENIPGLWNILTTCTCVFCGGGIQLSSLGINNPLWYVSVLFICYTVLYSINHFSKKIEIHNHYLYIGMVLLGLGIRYYGINLPFMNGDVSRGYVCFFEGILLYELYNNYANRKLFISSAFVAVVISLCIIKNWLIDDIWAILVFLEFPSLLFCFLWTEKFFTSKIFDILGRISFEMYLWHSPFILFYHLIKVRLEINNKSTHIEMFCFTCILILLCIPISLVLEKRIQCLCSTLMNRNIMSRKIIDSKIIIS